MHTDAQSDEARRTGFTWLALSRSSASGLARMAQKLQVVCHSYSSLRLVRFRPPGQASR